MKHDIAKFVSNHPDRISGISLALLGGLLAYAASPLPIGHVNAPDSGFFPTVLTTLLITTGAVLALQSIRGKSFSLELTDRGWAIAPWAISLVVYALLVEQIGFLVCTWVTLTLLLRIYGQLRWRTTFAVAIPLVFLVFVGFRELGVPLPGGILGW